MLIKASSEQGDHQKDMSWRREDTTGWEIRGRSEAMGA